MTESARRITSLDHYRRTEQLMFLLPEEPRLAWTPGPGVAPFLKWAGGKSQLLPQLLPHVPPQFKTYIEPFLGGGALFFRLEPSAAVLADSNADLINCYMVVRDHTDELIKHLEVYEAHHSKEFYYRIRSEAPRDEVQRAARLIYLNRTCYNGLYRVNQRGQFNVPMGRYKNPVICDAPKLRAASRALVDAQLVCADYAETLARYASPGDFVYIDPPYHPVSRYSDFKRYTADVFGEEDQRKLAVAVRELAQRGCHVLVSNSFSPFILELYAGCEVTEVTASRRISKDPGTRAEVKEVLISCS